MPRRFSDDLKARVPVLFYDHHLDVRTICKYLGMKKSLAYNILNQYDNHLDSGIPVHTHSKRSGRPRTLNAIDEQFIFSLIEHCPCLYLDEIQDALLQARRINVSIPLLFRTLKKLEITRKVVSVKAIERDEVRRSHFMLQIARIAPRLDMLIFIDEAARNRRTSHRRYGRSVQGHRCVQRRHFVRGKRVSILPALTIDGIIAYDILPGSVTSKTFLQFLEQHVVSVSRSCCNCNHSHFCVDSIYNTLPWTSKCHCYG